MLKIKQAYRINLLIPNVLRIQRNQLTNLQSKSNDWFLSEENMSP